MPEPEHKLNAWLTYKQAQELGGHVKKGEKSVSIVYASSYTKKVENEQTGETREETRGFLKSYRVLNVEQTEGLPAHLYQVIEPRPFEDRRNDVEAFIEGLGATIKHGGSKAAYNRARDLIKLPYPRPSWTPTAITTPACTSTVTGRATTPA